MLKKYFTIVLNIIIAVEGSQKLKNKQFSLIAAGKTEVVGMLNKLDITRFIYIKDDWACEAQNGTGNFFQKFKGVKCCDNFDDEPFKNGY